MTGISGVGPTPIFESAETIVRRELAKTPLPANGKNRIATGQAKIVEDTIAKAKDADAEMAFYGSDARFKALVATLKYAVQDKTLRSIGAGPASAEVNSPTTTRETGKLSDGTTGTLETTIKTRSITQKPAKKNGGIGEQREFRETIVRESNGEGAPGIERTETKEIFQKADAGKGALIQNIKLRATITNAKDGTTTHELHEQAIVYRLSEKGDIVKSVREVLTRVILDTKDGSKKGATQVESEITAKLDGATGKLTVDRSDQALKAVDLAAKAARLLNVASESALVLEKAGTDQAPKAGNVYFQHYHLGNEVAKTKTGELSLSTSESFRRLYGIGTMVTAAGKGMTGRAGWQRADGSIGGGYVVRSTGFNLVADPDNPGRRLMDVPPAGRNVLEVVNVNRPVNGNVAVESYGTREFFSREYRETTPRYDVKPGWLAIQHTIKKGTETAAFKGEGAPWYEEKTNSYELAKDKLTFRYESAAADVYKSKPFLETQPGQVNFLPAAYYPLRVSMREKGLSVADSVRTNFHHDKASYDSTDGALQASGRKVGSWHPSIPNKRTLEYTPGNGKLLFADQQSRNGAFADPLEMILGTKINKTA